MNCWNLWKLGALLFHLQLASHGNRSEYIPVDGCFAMQPAMGLKAKASAQRYGTIDVTSVLLLTD